MAKTTYDLIINVNEVGFEGMTSALEDSLEFVKEHDEFYAQDLYELIRDDIPNAPELYEDAAVGVLDDTIDKVTGTEGSIELTYGEGRVMGLYATLEVLHEMKEKPIAAMMSGGFEGGLKQKLEAVYRDRTEALVD